MKFLAIIQIVIGALASFTSWKLIESKAHTFTNPSSNGIWVDAPPPNFVFEIVLLFLGTVILTCGLLQFKARMKCAVSQITSGVFVVIISTFFTFRAATIGYGERDCIYYVIYLPLIAGLVVSIIGFIQLLHELKLHHNS